MLSLECLDPYSSIENSSQFFRSTLSDACPVKSSSSTLSSASLQCLVLSLDFFLSFHYNQLFDLFPCLFCKGPGWGGGGGGYFL